MKIPFWLHPRFWFLSGKNRKIAKLKYYYSGEELDRKLLSLEFEDVNLYENPSKFFEYQEKSMKIDEKYGKVTSYETQRKIIEFKEFDEKEKALKLLELDLKFNKIDQITYEREKANILQKPWVIVKDSKFNPEQGTSGFEIELEYNSYFVDFLRKNGYGNIQSETEMIETWLTDLFVSEFKSDIDNFE
ncbi:MAG: hypothetical protein NC934_07025 [Candidatus Omnitrophica bacterium]|nr:hypothetical protein [Candidatus Omnitrophota bacterium]